MQLNTLGRLVLRVASRMDSVGIFIPSLNRPHFLRELVKNIHEVTPEPHTLNFCVSDPESI